ncbi:MAG: pilin [bacterium]|nr:pilin [bacterium]
MMKKILSILAIVFLSIIIAPSVFADCGTGPDCPLGPPVQHCVNTGGAVPIYSCSYCSSYCASPNSCFLRAGSYVCDVPPTNPLLSGPPNCVKVNSTFTVKLPVGNTKNAITFHSGITVSADSTVICPGETSAFANCSMSAGRTNSSDCSLPNDQSSQIGIIGMLNVVYSVTNWVFFLLTILAVLMIIYGGFVYITAAGDPAKATTAKSILTFAVIGLAIALLAKFIPSLVGFILGV